MDEPRRDDPGDDEALVDAIVERLGGRDLAVAESCTAGALCQALAAAGGGSDWLRGGLVAYQVPVKRKLLGVEAAQVVSEPAARQMAEGVARLLDAQVAVATTGVAGEEPQDGIAPGTVVVGTWVAGRARARTHHFDGGPAEVCGAAVTRALRDLLADLADVAGRA